MYCPVVLITFLPVPKQQQQQQQQQEQHSWHPLEGADLHYVDCTKHFESSLVLDHRQSRQGLVKMLMLLG